MTDGLPGLLTHRERLSPTARAAVARAMLRLEELAHGARQRTAGPVWLDDAEEPDAPLSRSERAGQVKFARRPAD